MSCRRRRSPPERSRTSVRACSPRKPKRSQSMPGRDLRAVAERRARRGPASSDSSTRRSPGDLGGVLREVGEPHGRAALDRRPASARARRASSSSSVVLPEPLTPTSADAVAGARAARSRRAAAAGRRRRRDTSSASSTLSPSRAVGEAQQLGAVARLGLVGDQRVGGLDAELRLATCAPAARGAATRAPCAAAAGGGPRARPPGGRARRARARRPRSRPRTGGPRRRRPPTSRCRRRRGTSGRG